MKLTTANKRRFTAYIHILRIFRYIFKFPALVLPKSHHMPYINIGKTLLAAAFVIACVSSCKKKDHGGGTSPTDSATAATRSKDTLYFIFKDEYLWADALPDSATFKPRSQDSLQSEVTALKSYKKDSVTPTANKDHYTFLDDGAVSNELDNGVSGDFGFQIQYQYRNDLRALYVYPGSPADLAGVKRGYKVIAVNGDTSLYYTGSDGGANVDRLVQAFYYSSTTSFTFQKPDNSTVTVSLTTANYSINPLLFSKIYTIGGRKIGYFVFNQFISKTLVKSNMDALFDSFVAAGVTDVIVDLRYNGGGSVETSEYLANLLAPTSVGTGNKTLMYTEYFNTNISNKSYNKYTKAMLLDGQYKLSDEWDYLVDNNKAYFDKQKTLSPTNVVFIATDNTASASELLINNLKPVLPNWYQVGTVTYGKPVGFIGITIGGKDLYAISFAIKNSQNVGDYYYGLQPTGNNVIYEDAAEDFGDVSEVYLNAAFHQLGITDGDLGLRKKNTIANTSARVASGAGLKMRGFNGMIKKLPHQH